MDAIQPILVTIPDAGRALGIGKSKLRQLIKEDKLETRRIGRRVLVTTASITAFVETLE